MDDKQFRCQRKARKQALLFVNKKKQKNFDFIMSHRAVAHGAKRSKSFLVLFFKKEHLPFYQ
jgi:hypothetical protein